MTQVLLEQLNKTDIQWLKETGIRQQIRAGTVLIKQNNQVDFLYIIITGSLLATIARNESSVLASVFAALEDDPDLEEEIAHFSTGDVLGEMSFLDINPSVTTVKANHNCQLLVIPKRELREKLTEDLGFASRFYRAIAILLLDRFERIVQIYLRKKLGKIPLLQDVPLIFGELSDSDVDWMLREGTLKQIPSGTTLIQTGRQIENFYVVLIGIMSIAVTEEKKNMLTSIFSALENDEETEEPLEMEIARASIAEIIGEIAALDSHTSISTIKALENSSVLEIPRQKLLSKLQQDIGMASRFYRVIALLLSGRLQGLISRLGFGPSSYETGNSLALEEKYEDEIDLDIMDNITQGGARFDWMLKRLNLRVG